MLWALFPVCSLFSFTSYSSRFNRSHTYLKTYLSSKQDQDTVEPYTSRRLLNTFIMCHRIFWEPPDCRINCVKFRSHTNCKSRVLLLEAPGKDFGRAEQGLKMSPWVCFNLWKCAAIAGKPRSCVKVPDLILKECITAHFQYVVYTVLGNHGQKTRTDFTNGLLFRRLSRSRNEGVSGGGAERRFVVHAWKSKL